MADFAWKGKTLKPGDDLSWRDVDGELVALNTDSGKYYSFNDVGREVWLAVAEGKSMEDLLNLVESEYDVPDRDTAAKDVEKFLVDLMDAKLVYSLPS